MKTQTGIFSRLAGMLPGRRQKQSDLVAGVKRRLRTARMFTAPAFLFQLIFGWIPVVIAVPIAMSKYSIFRGVEYVGLQNFMNIVYDDLVWHSLKTTFTYAILSIGLTFFIPIVVSILLLEMRKNVVRIMMILWFIPISGVASIFLWKWIYNDHYGLLNIILNGLGLPSVRWLNDPDVALFALILPAIISFGPSLIWIPALQAIPDSFYEAAELEGVGFWRKIWTITLPRIRPVMAMLLLLSIIGGLQVFQQPFILTGGGPNYATLTAVLHIYNLAMVRLNFGQGMAYSLFLFAIIMTITIVYRKYFKEDLDKA